MQGERDCNYRPSDARVSGIVIIDRLMQVNGNVIIDHLMQGDGTVFLPDERRSMELLLVLRLQSELIEMSFVKHRVIGQHI